MSRIEEDIREVEQKIYALAGHEFNIESDEELAKVLFDEMGLVPRVKTKSGYSVRDGALYPLIDTPIISELWEYRNLKVIQKNPNVQYLEMDGMGRIVGGGSDADFDTHALQVMNGEGYYDETGRYRSYGYYD